MRFFFSWLIKGDKTEAGKLASLTSLDLPFLPTASPTFEQPKYVLDRHSLG